MGTLVVGVPGSGKSYLAVNKIFVSAFNDKSLEYIYSNIEGLKIDYLNKTLTDQGKKCRVIKLDMDLLKHHIYIMWSIIHDDKGNDEDLILYCKIYKIFNTHFYIDEAHNHFMQQNKKIVWWFSYVRHMNQDYTLLTQNKDLIATKYRGFPEYFTRVKPPSHRLSGKTMVYTDFSSFAMQDKQKIRSYSIKMQDEIFNLYHSGGTLTPKLFLLKTIGSAVAFLIVFGGVLYWFSSYKNSQSSDIRAETENEYSIVEREGNSYVDSVPSSDAQNYRVFCDDEYCDLYKGRSKAQYPYQYFIAVLGTIDSKILYQRALYVYKGKVSSDVEMYVRINDNEALEYFPDFYLLRDDPVDTDAIFNVVPEDLTDV